MIAPEILYLTMMSVMKVCSRSQNLYPDCRSVKNASTGLSIAGCGFSGVAGISLPYYDVSHEGSSRSQNLCPGRSVKNASIGLSIAGCDFSGVEGYRAGCFVGVAERAFFPSGDAEVPCSCCCWWDR